MMVSPLTPTLGAICCQISSVMNGIIGWAMRRMVSSTRNSVRRVPRLASALTPSLFRTGLVSSRYQSQYSFQMGSVVETVFVQCLGDLGFGFLQAGNDPAVGDT